MTDVSMAKGRSNARKKAMQALYQWSIGGNDLGEIEVQFHQEQDMSKVDQDYFHMLLHEVPAQVETLDDMLTPCLDRQQHEVDPVEKAILRISAYEIKNRIDVPYKVIIKEAIQLANIFGSDLSHKFVNAVLDKLAKQHRQAEMPK
ncbi:MAG: transcription antitermination factor NusB [Gammaproteobacteria bacterium]|nr:transcription antitermination factor NusB [Gammaproteobacteria bacterium]